MFFGLVEHRFDNTSQKTYMKVSKVSRKNAEFVILDM